MTARLARHSDVPKILKLAKAAHRKSRYASVPFDEGQCLAAIRHHIGMGLPPSPGGTALFIAGDIEAALGAMCVPLYECLGAVMITDTFWFSRGKDPRAGLSVLRAFHSWAGQCAGAHVIRQGVTDFISNHERTGKVLEHKGFRKVGAIYEKECLA